MKIAIVVSQFNEVITKKLYKDAVIRLIELGVLEAHIETAWVPGAIELPLMAQQFARTGEYEAVICLGAVIRGETDHYDYVCQQVSFGCQKVALKHNLPVIFGVLTTHTVEQAEARAGGAHSHKGIEAAESAIAMIKTLYQNKMRMESKKYA